MHVQIGQRHLYVRSKEANSGAGSSHLGQLCVVVLMCEKAPSDQYETYFCVFPDGYSCYLYDVELVPVSYLETLSRSVEKIKVT